MQKQRHQKKVDSFSIAGFNKVSSTLLNGGEGEKLSVNAFLYIYLYIYIYIENISYFAEGDYLSYKLNVLIWEKVFHQLLAQDCWNPCPKINLDLFIY